MSSPPASAPAKPRVDVEYHGGIDWREFHQRIDVALDAMWARKAKERTV